jgi:hypothetical protein
MKKGPVVLQKASVLTGYSLRAQDGDIGKVVDFLFSDAEWTVRYLVVDTGEWLESRQVLISPIALRSVNDPAGIIQVALEKNQVENSPELDTAKPVSRHYEMKYHQYYRWPYYWEGMGLWGAWGYPAEMMREVQSWKERVDRGDEPENPHLRSINEVTEYQVSVRDGEIGHIEDFIIDDRTWSVRYLEIDTRNWWPGGKKVLLARQWVEHVSWEKREVDVDVDRKTIKDAPEYNEREPISEKYELALFKHYGRKLEKAAG